MLKKKLMSWFKMADAGNVLLVLGMHVSLDGEKGILTIRQEDYTKSMPKRLGMSECKSLSTPSLRTRVIVGATRGEAPG